MATPETNWICGKCLQPCEVKPGSYWDLYKQTFTRKSKCCHADATEAK